ncbi:MAG: PQQ-binding-like beta-propeller repeat protein, partial [Planctomycetota bacterium]
GSVVDGLYYQFDAITTGRGGQERLRAIDLQTGQVLWTQSRPMLYRDMYGYESGPRGTPAVQGDRIITFGVAGDLCCRNLADGKLIWSVDTNSDYGVVQNFFGVGSSPLILDDKVIVPVGGSPSEDQALPPGRLDRVAPNDSAMVAFDLETGRERWRSGDELASYSSPRTMTIDGKTALLYFARDSLLAVDPDDGRLLWSFSHGAELLESVNAAMPVVLGDQVFLSECYEIGSVLLSATREKATVVWQDDVDNRRKQVMRAHWSTPILIDGYLYGCSGRNNPDSDFRCIEFATGKLQWNDDRRIRSSCTRAGDHLVVLEERGEMQIVRPDPQKLNVVAEFDFSDLIRYPCWAAPIIVGNRMLIRGDKNVVCLAMKTKP